MISQDTKLLVLKYTVVLGYPTGLAGKFRPGYESSKQVPLRLFEPRAKYGENITSEQNQNGTQFPDISETQAKSKERIKKSRNPKRQGKGVNPLEEIAKEIGIKLEE